MALGSSSPPEIRTEGVRPEKSDTEMVFVPEMRISSYLSELSIKMTVKCVLSAEQGPVVVQFAVRDFLP